MEESKEHHGWESRTDLVRCYNCYKKVTVEDFVQHCAQDHPDKEMGLLRDVGWGKHQAEHFGVKPNELRCDISKAFISTKSWKLMAPCDDQREPVEPAYL